MSKLKVLDLFSGIGGFSLGLERAGMETAAFCEIDPFCRKVLAKHWPWAPLFEDVRKLNGKDLKGSIDVICGGYPCQPFSLAGKRAGEGDDRHLWPEVARLILEVSPTWFIGENVAGHISMGLDDVLSDLEGLNYTTETCIIPAVALDAKHRRDRVWIVAHSDSERRRQKQKLGPRREDSSNSWNDGKTQSLADSHRGECSRIDRRQGKEVRSEKFCEDVANANSIGPKERLAGSNGCGKREARGIVDKGDACRGKGNREELGRWPAEPGVGRVAHGIPRRVDRLRALGNAVVPQVVEIIGRAIIAAAK